MSHWNSVAGAVRRTWSRREGASCAVSCRGQGSSSLGQCSARCACTGFWKSPLTLGTEGACACVSFSCSRANLNHHCFLAYCMCSGTICLVLWEGKMLWCAWMHDTLGRLGEGHWEAKSTDLVQIQAWLLLAMWSWTFYFCELYFP